MAETTDTDTPTTAVPDWDRASEALHGALYRLALAMTEVHYRRDAADVRLPVELLRKDVRDAMRALGLAEADAMRQPVSHSADDATCPDPTCAHAVEGHGEDGCLVNLADGSECPCDLPHGRRKPSQEDVLEAARRLVRMLPDVPMVVESAADGLWPGQGGVLRIRTHHGHSGDVLALASLRTVAEHFGATPFDRYAPATDPASRGRGPAVEFALDGVPVQVSTHLGDAEVIAAARAWIADAGR